MSNYLFDLNNIRFEISFKSYKDLRSLLCFYQKNNLYKINIPCKNTLKKDFLLNSIKISCEEFPNNDVIPHFSILHEFRRNSLNTQNSFNKFLRDVKSFGCKEVLLISGSQKRSTLDSVLTLYQFKDNPIFSNSDFSLGVAFNPYLPSFLFEEELKRLEKKINSGLISSIWIQFGTDIELLKSRMKILRSFISCTTDNSHEISDIKLFGSVLIPSKQFLARFKYRPWKGVYCSNDFLESVDFANNLVTKLLNIYKQNQIYPIVETNISKLEHLESLINILKF